MAVFNPRCLFWSEDARTRQRIQKRREREPREKENTSLYMDIYKDEKKKKRRKKRDNRSIWSCVYTRIVTDRLKKNQSINILHTTYVERRNQSITLMFLHCARKKFLTRPNPWKFIPTHPKPAYFYLQSPRPGSHISGSYQHVYMFSKQQRKIEEMLNRK
jgi:hypothetical protein